MIKSFLRRAATRIAPQATTAFLSARARARSHELIEQWGLAELNRKLIDTLGAVVQDGPFRGLTLSPMTWKEHLGPYLLGTYESELHPWFARILRQTYTGVVDVGAKFGYYAVGIARLYPGVQVVAFDTDSWARKATREMARANSVAEKVEVFGYCTPARLASVLTERTLIVSDCEGYERVLFGNAAPRALGSSTIIVELHEDLRPGVEAAIQGSLGVSHTIEKASTTGSSVGAIPANLSFLPAGDALRAVQELRPPQSWLLLRPRET